jgi:hypothetical protein
MDLVPSLLRIHDYGIMTTQSQPAVAGPLETGDGGYFERRQIPFVTFFILCEDAATEGFLNALLNDSRLVVSAIDFRQDSPVLWPKSCTGDSSVTYDRSGRSMDGLLKAQWESSYGMEAGPFLFEESDLGEVSAAIGLPLVFCAITQRHDLQVVELPEAEFLRRVESINVLEIVEGYAVEHLQRLKL